MLKTNRSTILLTCLRKIDGDGLGLSEPLGEPLHGAQRQLIAESQVHVGQPAQRIILNTFDEEGRHLRRLSGILHLFCITAWQ
jgi:hypothetical protein